MGCHSMIKRRQDWQVRLSQYLTEAGCRRFRWGSHDCVMHCVSAIKAITGEDLGAEYRGRYRGRSSAKALRDEIWNGSIDNAFTEHFGPMLGNMRKAKRGDVAKSFTDDGEEVYGVVDDTGRAVCLVTASGLTRWPLDRFVGFWSVG